MLKKILPLIKVLKTPVCTCKDTVSVLRVLIEALDDKKEHDCAYVLELIEKAEAFFNELPDPIKKELRRIRNL